MVALEKSAAKRIQKAVERFAETGTGNVRKLQGIDPPEYRLRIGNFRVRFHSTTDSLTILRVLDRKEAYR